MDHDGGDSRSLMSARLHSSISKEAAVFFYPTNVFTFIRTRLPFIQAAENVQKVQQKDLLQILNWHTIIEMGNQTAVILNR